MTTSHVISKMAAGSGVAKGGIPELKNRKLKEKAVAFYAQHNVPATIEKLLNGMFLAAPSDVYGYMSEYFHGLSKEPVISSLSAHKTLDSSGGQAIKVDLYCTVNGSQKLISTGGVSLEPYPQPPDPAHIPTTGKGGGGKSGSKSIVQKPSEQPEVLHDENTEPPPSENCIDPTTSVCEHISTALQGISPKEQCTVDNTLAGLVTAEGELKLHPGALQATSFGTAIAGASLLNSPLYLHLANTYFPETQKFTMPTPVVSILTGGHLGCGKLRMREFCLVPFPGVTFPEQIRSLVTVYQEMGKVLTAKSGPSAQGSLTATGAYCPVIDKPEQALDLLQEATRSAGMQLNQDMGVMIDIGADKLYDQEKGKYEIVAGQWKTSEDLISLYHDLLQSYPGLLGYIDPLHHLDARGWKMLGAKLGSRCLLVADQTLKGLLLNAGDFLGEQPAMESGSTDCGGTKGVEEGQEPQETKTCSVISCAALALQPTLSETVQKATHLRGYSPYIMLMVPSNLTMNTVSADLAVAMQCRFLRLAAPTGLTSTGMLSQLQCIRESLVAKKIHEPIKAHVFMSALLNAEEYSRNVSD